MRGVQRLSLRHDGSRLISSSRVLQPRYDPRSRRPRANRRRLFAAGPVRADRDRQRDVDGRRKTMHRWLFLGREQSRWVSGRRWQEVARGASATVGSDGGTSGDDAGSPDPAGTVTTLDDQPVALAVIGKDRPRVALFTKGIVTGARRAGGTVTPLVPIPSAPPRRSASTSRTPSSSTGTTSYFSESSGGRLHRAALSRWLRWVAARRPSSPRLLGFTAGSRQATRTTSTGSTRTRRR